MYLLYLHIEEIYGKTVKGIVTDEKTPVAIMIYPSGVYIAEIISKLKLSVYCYHDGGGFDYSIGRLAYFKPQFFDCSH